MTTSVLGTSVLRTEDPALLTGERPYSGDLAARHPATPSLHLHFVRSEMAHARIHVDVDEARDAPGVIDVFTAATLGMAPYNTMFAAPVPEALLRPPLADGVVRFVGESVACVVATSPASAADAAALVVVDYDELPAVVDPEVALHDEVLVHPAHGTNLAGTFADPGAALPDTGGFGHAAWVDDADVTVSLVVENQRVAVMPMETNTIWVRPAPATDSTAPRPAGIEVWCSTQAPHIVRDMLAKELALDTAAVVVHTVAVGGGFGAKSCADPEYVVAAVLALRLDRPVTWRQSREENLLAMNGRAQRQYVQLGATGDGRLVGLRADLVADAGAYPAVGTYLPALTRLMLSGVYRIDRIESTARCAATHTTPVTAYRGAGRPEASHLLERTMDVLAAEIGVDPVELRRRNLIPADAFPYHSPTGAVYDVGDYARALDEACRVAGYDELRAMQAQRRAAGERWQLGIGVSVYVEVTANAPQSEYASVEVHADGTVTVVVGTASHGQGHATTFAQIVAHTLGVAHGDVRVVSGDTGAVPRGGGTFASRSVQVGGAAIHHASSRLAERAAAVAAHLLEASVDDVVRHDDGSFGVAGVPSSGLTWARLAEATAAGAVPPELAGPLAVADDWARPAATFPFGAHVAVVEVDTETGEVRWVDHVAVDDCGTVINPLLAEGQVHGGIAQGGAQALYEQMVHTADGTPLTASLVDYAAPSAAEVPSFRTARTVTPTPVNELGAKGIGESGTIGALPAVHNAVVDAVAHLGVRHIEMPCTPERVWRAVTDAASGSTGSTRG